MMKVFKQSGRKSRNRLKHRLHRHVSVKDEDKNIVSEHPVGLTHDVFVFFFSSQDSLSYNERFQLYQKRKAFVEEHNSKQGGLAA